MVKCSICNKKIEYTFLGKILGTYVKKNAKLYPICNECQKRYKTKEEILLKIK
ncbi:MAG: hypothetical protein QXE31_04675 [Candidatus Woesearchaeota archaeon]